MNERIKELVDQILPNEKEWHKGDPKDWGYFFSGDELEKFAELLIQKCADIGERYADGNYEIRNQILIHFGLEEPEE
jgi:hypothetical protein